jgi:hypothetical protein
MCTILLIRAWFVVQEKYMIIARTWLVTWPLGLDISTVDGYHRQSRIFCNRSTHLRFASARETVEQHASTSDLIEKRMRRGFPTCLE